MPNISPKTEHLKQTQWKPGQSGNPTGKPKGTKHLSTYIREMMADDEFQYTLDNKQVIKGAPIEAVVKTIIIKAVMGDLRAFDLLARYGYGTKIELETKELPVPILSGLSMRGADLKSS